MNARRYDAVLFDLLTALLTHGRYGPRWPGIRAQRVAGVSSTWR
jgi:hypothetical protein